MQRVHHFPKWLWDEHFELTHVPGDKKYFRILLHSETGSHYGIGDSITAAAKAALQYRDHGKGTNG